MTKEVLEKDFRRLEFVGADPKDYEFRYGDNKIVRKDRWEQGIRRIAFLLDRETEFEIDELIDDIRALIEQSHKDITNE